MSNRRKAFQVLLNIALIAVFVSSALAGGWWWLMLVPAAIAVFQIYRVFRPADPAIAPQRFREPGNHRVVLQVTGPQAIRVIYDIRVTTGADLATAKKLAEDAPVIVAENLSESSAGLIVDRLTKAGARAMAAPIGEK
ncbi:ribosomal protein L7/L12 [Kineosporia sp. J2-2]|uniref:Ribosomal protein L7/L12 n=1 Tax=Kineosporia corallincola TaxID=2835133 RepID=A0ABS5TID3_9ACTN|nr:ribosomal protein L7/L12 [Kineosporia corallincola]MBT0770837.1 ribosomal protein L7/L12 [Kineosporia corallincola]